jgi:beta-N-acetylhexosaminidase
MLSYEAAQPDSELLEWIKEGVCSGVVIFRENAPDEETLATAVAVLREAADKPFCIMIDEEGGPVRRLPDTDESMPALRSYATGDTQQVAADYATVADRLTRLGIDTMLAPVVDCGGRSSEWLRQRTFSDDPDEVATMARVVIPAIHNRNVNACAKHFPGMRAVADDPHGTRAVDTTPPSEWDQIDAVPFRAAVTSGVRMVMVGHHIMMGFDAMMPACLSPAVVSMLLRQRLGFGGLVLTDDLAMAAITDHFPIEQAVQRALAAGCDLLLICRNRELQRRAVAHWRDMQTAGREI